MNESQEVDFQSNIYEKTLFQDNRVCVCKFRKFVKVLNYKIVNSNLNTHTQHFDIGLIEFFKRIYTYIYYRNEF